MPDFYDVFVSYAHADDVDGWVTAFVDALQREHYEFALRRLDVFFDHNEIQTLDDWELKILTGLRGTKVLLAVLSPDYFASKWCRREWHWFTEHQLDRGLADEVIAPIYTVTVPGYEREGEEQIAEWVNDLQRRRRFDVRDWRKEGARAFQLDDVRRRLQKLDQGLDEQIKRQELRAAGPCTVPQHNRRFVGRRDQLRGLHGALTRGQVGAVTALHGLGGIGKSALAFEYAHAFADHYPGGRFLAPCAGATDLRAPLVNLAGPLSVELSDDEKKDLDAAYARVRAALEAGDRKLIVLDNVDDPALLCPADPDQAGWLPNSDRVHLLATTRLAPDRLAGVVCLALDSLSEQEAADLIAGYRPYPDAERETALAIARQLGGHALAVEVVAVYLAKNPDVSLAGYLEWLQEEGVEALTEAAEDDRVTLSRNQEKFVGQLLEATLAGLTPAELRCVELAAQLAPDFVGLPWLRELTGRAFPEVVAAPTDDRPDAWLQIVRRLQGLRLFTETDAPEIVRLHRVVAAVVRARCDDLDSRREQTLNYLRERAIWVREHWMEPGQRWALRPLAETARRLFEVGDAACGAVLANCVADPWVKLAELPEARALLESALAAQEAAGGVADEDLATTYHLLAWVEQDCGHLELARDRVLRAAEVERSLGPDRPELGTCYGDLALIEQSLGHLDVALENAALALDLIERAYGPDDVNTAFALNNLATIEHAAGHWERARELDQRCVAIDEKVYGPDHPDLASDLSNLAVAEQKLDHLEEARGLLDRAVAIDEKVFGKDHLHTSVRYANLASLYHQMGENAQACELFAHVLAVRRTALDEDHLKVVGVKINYAIALAEKRPDEDATGLSARLDSAAELLGEAMDSLARTRSADHPELGRAASVLAEVELARGRLDEAESWAEKALSVHRRHFAEDADAVVDGRLTLARVWARRGATEPALGEGRAILATRTARYGAAHAKTREAAEFVAQLERASEQGGGLA